MKILIVDDSKAMRMIVKATMLRAGYKEHIYEEATNGKEALETIGRFGPDLILADWNMPEMSGIELLEAIKKQGLQIKFGFVTAVGSPLMRQKAEEEGALFLITKPFTPEIFQKALNPILSC